jgi:hypothetical protein
MEGAGRFFALPFFMLTYPIICRMNPNKPLFKALNDGDESRRTGMVNLSDVFTKC